MVGLQIRPNGGGMYGCLWRTEVTATEKSGCAHMSLRYFVTKGAKKQILKERKREFMKERLPELFRQMLLPGIDIMDVECA